MLNAVTYPAKKKHAKASLLKFVESLSGDHSLLTESWNTVQLHLDSDQLEVQLNMKSRQSDARVYDCHSG